jgi:hypothetical protein
MRSASIINFPNISAEKLVIPFIVTRLPFNLNILISVFKLPNSIYILLVVGLADKAKLEKKHGVKKKCLIRTIRKLNFNLHLSTHFLHSFCLLHFTLFPFCCSPLSCDQQKWLIWVCICCSFGSAFEISMIFLKTCLMGFLLRFWFTIEVRYFVFSVIIGHYIHVFMKIKIGQHTKVP